MNRRSFFAGFLAAVHGAGAARGASASDVVRRAISGAAADVDGERIVLADIIPPAFDAGPMAARPGPEPYAAAARDAFQALLARPDFSIAPIGQDRWGRTIARAAANGRSVEAALVAAGAVRVNPTTNDDDGLIAALLAAEQEARAARRGLWALRAYRVVDATSGAAPIGRFCLVEGPIVAANVRRGRAYVNFGDDYRTDVTATAPARRLARWALNGDPTQEDLQARLARLPGRIARVRGVALWINGPSFDLVHPQQVTILDAPGGDEQPAIAASLEQAPQALSKQLAPLPGPI